MPKANSGTFDYPGGKTTLAPWIIDHFPDHECYVEPFGGSASVLYQKPQSDIEVYNDLDSSLVNLFRTIRDRPDELREWLDATPYSREIHADFSAALSEDDYDDDLEWAGMFFYILQTSYSGKLRSPSFATQSAKGSTHYSRPEQWGRSVENLRNIGSRFDSVIVEHLDYTDCIERYDGEDTLFYLDPPYVTDSSHYAVEDGFDHSELVETLSTIEGRFILSYDVLPEGLEGYTTVTRERKWTVSSGDDETAGTEKLVMNYDPAESDAFNGVEQSGLKEWC